MKRILLIALLAVTSIAAAQDANALRSLALRFANAADLVYQPCPDGLERTTECIIGSGNKELDKLLIDRHFTDLTIAWNVPWISANPTSFGRSASTYYGEVIIITMETNPYSTLIVLWYAD